MDKENANDSFINEMIQQAEKKSNHRLNESERAKLNGIIKQMIQNDASLKEAMGLTQQFLESLYSMAYQQYKSGKYKDSGALFRLLNLSDPNDTRFSMGLAASKQMQGDYDEAILAYHLCGQLDLNNPIPYFYLSECYRKKNNHRSALYSLYQTLLRINRNPVYHPLLEKTQLLIEGLQKEVEAENDALLRENNIDPEEYRKTLQQKQTQAAEKSELPQPLNPSPSSSESQDNMPFRNASKKASLHS